MRRIRFGRTEASLSPVAVGTWSFGGPQVKDGEPVGWSGHSDEDAVAALIRAFELGQNHWDTADVYGDGRAERLIGGTWGSVSRGDVFLASKMGYDSGDFDHFYDPTLIRSRLERSLINLKTEWIDLYYLHHCNFGPNDEHFEDAVATVQTLRAEGKIRFLGLSDWDCRKVARFAPMMDPDAVQFPRNVMEDDCTASGLKAWVEANDVGSVFFGPLKHGLLLGKYATPPEFGEGDVRDRLGGFRDAGLLEALVKARHAVEERFPDHPQPVLHALIGVLLADAESGCCLVGQRTREQAEAAAAVGQPLSVDDAAWVREVYRNVAG